MAMSENARSAFEELQKLGAPVRDWGENDGYPPDTAFVLIWANDDATEVFADISGEHIRELYVDGRYINPMGFRQDVHEILARYNLVTEWQHRGQVVVYNAPDAPGTSHADEARRSGEGQR